MSSSSSSDCECEDYCHYTTGFYENYYGDTVNRTPYYPTMGHPLIYYTQTGPFNPSQPMNRSKNRKRDPNCFIRAWRWYTQERVSKGSDVQSNGNDFASWLDMKYYEYLKNKSGLQTNYDLTVKQTSIIKTEKTIQNLCADTCNNNVISKFKRLKSPWRRKRCCSRSCKGDDQSNPSCQYILPPKDMIRPNSECCQPCTPSLESQKRKPSKSQSLTNLSGRHSKNEPIEVCCTLEGLPPINVSRTKSDLVDGHCQCSLCNVTKVDAQTQYEDVSLVKTQSLVKKASSTKSHKKLKQPSRAKSPKTNTVDCECGSNVIIEETLKTVKKSSSADAGTQYEPPVCKGSCVIPSCPGVQVPKPPPRKCPCEMDSDEFMMPPLRLIEIAAQTSNRNITFGNCEPPYNYPLFMKIICADKN